MPENNSNNLENQNAREPSFEERMTNLLELILRGQVAMQAQIAAMQPGIAAGQVENVISENNGNSPESRTTSEPSHEERVMQRLDLILAEQAAIRTEMVQRFLQLSCQIRDFDIKVDIYTREHSYMKDDIREVRAKMNLQ